MAGFPPVSASDIYLITWECRKVPNAFFFLTKEMLKIAR